MRKIVLISGLLILAIALSGCPDDGSGYASLRNDGTPYSGTGSYDDPNTTYYDTGDPNYSNTGNNGTGNTDSGSGDCGYFEGPCCEYVGTDTFGMLTGYNYCNDGLDCRADTCVEGPTYQAYDPITHTYGE